MKRGYIEMRKKVLLGLTILIIISFSIVLSGCSEQNPIFGKWESADYQKQTWTINESMNITVEYDVQNDGIAMPSGPPEIPISGNREKSSANSALTSTDSVVTNNNVNHVVKNYNLVIDTTKNPYWIDIMDQSSRIEALYRFTNNNQVLEICYNNNDKTRPVSFDKGEVMRFIRK
jgi:uncharacterized protein (TIGR03067 family)